MSKYTSITTNKYIDKSDKSQTIEKRLNSAPIGNKYFQKVINPIIEKSNNLKIQKSKNFLDDILNAFNDFVKLGSKDTTKLIENITPYLSQVDNMEDLLPLLSKAKVPLNSPAFREIGDAWRAAKSAIPSMTSAISDATSPATRIASESNAPNQNTIIPIVPKYRGGTPWESKYVADINKKINDIVNSNIQLSDNDLNALKQSIENINYNQEERHRIYGNRWSLSVEMPNSLYEKIYKNEESSPDVVFSSNDENYHEDYSRDVLPEINKENEDFKRKAQMAEKSVQTLQRGLYDFEFNKKDQILTAIEDVKEQIDNIMKSNAPIPSSSLFTLNEIIKDIQHRINGHRRTYGDNSSWPQIAMPKDLNELIRQAYAKNHHPNVSDVFYELPKNTNRTLKNNEQLIDDAATVQPIDVLKDRFAQIESNNARNREQLAASLYEIPDQDLIRISQKIYEYESRVKYINSWINDLQKSGNKPNSGFYTVIRKLLTQASDIQKESRKIAKPINLPQLIIPESIHEKIYQQGILTLKNKKIASIIPDVKYNDTYGATSKNRVASESTIPNGANRTIYSTADDANTKGIIMNSSTTVPMPTHWYLSGNDRERFQNAITQYKNQVTDLNKWINNLTKLGREIDPITYTHLRQEIKSIQELKSQLNVAFDTYGKSEMLPQMVIPKSLHDKIYATTTTPNAKGEISSELSRNRDLAVIPIDDKYERDYMLRAFPDIKQRYGKTANLNYDETVLYQRERERERAEKEKTGGIIDYQKLIQEENARKAAEKAIADAAEKRRITDGKVLSTPEYLAYVQAQRANAPENIRALGTRPGQYPGINLVNSKWQFVDESGRTRGLLPSEIDQLIETGNLGHSNSGWTVTPSDKTRAYMGDLGVADALIAERDGVRPFPSAATARVATPSEIAETKDKRNARIINQYYGKYYNNMMDNFLYTIDNPKSFNEYINTPSWDEYRSQFTNRPPGEINFLSLNSAELMGLDRPISKIPGSDRRFKTFGKTPWDYYYQYQDFKIAEKVKTANELIAELESLMGKYYKKESLADQQDPAVIAQNKKFDAIENPTDFDVSEYWRNSLGEKIYPNLPNSMQLDNNEAWPSLQSVYDRHAAENAQIEANRTANAVAVANEKASRTKRRTANESSPAVIDENIQNDNYAYLLNQILNDDNNPAMESVIAALPKVLRSNKRVASETNIPDEGVDDSENVYENIGDVVMALEGKSASEQADIASKIINARTAEFSDDEIKFYEKTYGKNWHSKYPFGGINSLVESGQQPGLFATRRGSSGTKAPTYRNETFSVDPFSQRDLLPEIDTVSEKTVYPSDRFLKKRNKKNKK